MVIKAEYIIVEKKVPDGQLPRPFFFLYSIFVAAMKKLVREGILENK